MFVAKFDLSSDYTVFFLTGAIIMIILVLVSSRRSPKRAHRRRIDKQQGDRAGELIE